MFKRFLLGLSLLTGLSGTAAAEGGSEQIYFVAQVAPVGSLSSPGQDQQGVYLRWDVVEGSLPPDLARFRLERDGEELLDVSATVMMSDAEIAELYQGPAQQRRLLESLSWLQEQVSTEDSSESITMGNFPQQIRERAQTNPLWSALASRVDFNIARARYRGYLDLDAEGGTHTYELIGVNDGNEEVLLGRAVVDTNQKTRLSEPIDFQQVLQAQCDAPEAAKDHGAVALTWDHGGTNDTDRLANSLLVAGYDLYRDTQPLHGDMPARQIAALAAGAPHDQQGTPQIPGLERVNQQPIMISGRPEGNSSFVQTLETAKDIAEAGLKPGDQRVYYLVPRDFTGNYGPTIATLVTVPDLRPPPAPWSVEVETNDADNTFSLVWDAVNLINYHRNHDDGRQFCNLDSARAEKSLRYVPKGKVCGVDTEIEIRLDVDSYRVYRFDNYQAAAAFKDSDGDGYSDRDERRAGPGYSCDPNLTPSGAKNALLAEDGFRTRELSDGRQQVLFQDSYPAENKEEVVWYRIASVNANGLGSILTSPIRGHFPDRQLPKPPVFGQDIDLTTPADGSCQYEVRGSENSEGPMFLDTTGAATGVMLSCRTSQGAQRMSFPLAAGIDGAGVTPSASQCEALLDACGDAGGKQSNQVTIDFYETLSGGSLNQDTTTVDTSLLRSCPNVTRSFALTEAKMEGNCGKRRTVASGEVLNQPPQLTVSTNQCIAIYREIGGKDYKVDTVCNEQDALIDYGPSNASQGDMVCLSAATQNENARNSARTRLPCFSVVTPNQAPAAPQPMNMFFNDDQADVVWQLPEERVTATVLELYQPGDSARLTTTIPHPGARGGSQKTAVEVTAAPSGTDWQQEWCVRARAIGQAKGSDQSGVLSEWSSPLCTQRLPAGQELSKYLPWPEIPRPPVRDSLEALYLESDQLPILKVSRKVEFPHDCSFDLEQPVCSINDTGNDSCLDKSPPALLCKPLKGQPPRDPVCGPLRNATAGYLGFVAYRQSRPLGGGEANDFVQISPLIDDNFCSSSSQRDEQVGTIADPYLKLVLFDGDDPTPDLRVIFADRYPHLSGREYRYQFVYFSTDGEIIETRSSQDWLAVPQ